MKNQNEEIKQYLLDKGYQLYRDNISNAVECIINGVKIEWRSDRKCLVVGYGNDESDREELRQLIISSFGANSLSRRVAQYISFCKNPIFEDFIKLVDVIENIDFIIKQKVSPARGSVEKDTAGVFNKIAKAIKFHAELKLGQPNRKQCYMDDVDPIIYIGESIDFREGGIREHIVPCDFIIREAVEMFKEGKSITEVASMIQSNLKIVMVTEEEAKKMNNELGLISDMPDGWKIGDSVFARLEAAGIKLK